MDKDWVRGVFTTYICIYTNICGCLTRLRRAHHTHQREKKKRGEIEREEEEERKLGVVTMTRRGSLPLYEYSGNLLRHHRSRGRCSCNCPWAIDDPPFVAKPACVQALCGPSCPQLDSFRGPAVCALVL